ncbi:MBL fold metallo-hydrolase [Oceanispirochaeta crateris]|uniref:MBL fold metallo-hydrolase n=1 Tax=Oceanispirochaeta crateris TaxID=2518645 RepID=UPI00143D8C8B|nr:MBL fold metallo-hydrolase [Oceanispirochaeta crateris]
MVGHRGLKTEHGLSFLIEDEGQSILFDTASSPFFLNNAISLKKDLSKVTSVVLSHPHYDHTGGFRSFVDQWKTTEKKLYTGKDFFLDRFEANTFSLTYLGNSFSEKYLEENGIVWNCVKTFTKISEHCFVVSGFRQLNELETVPPQFKKKYEDSLLQDNFSDECSIVVEASDGLHVIVGCAHIGILNIIEQISCLFSQSVKAVYGGIHLMNSTRGEIEAVIDRLTNLGVEKCGLCHCSGRIVYESLCNHAKSIDAATLGSGSMLFL